MEENFYEIVKFNLGLLSVVTTTGLVVIITAGFFKVIKIKFVQEEKKTSPFKVKICEDIVYSLTGKEYK